MISAKSFFFVLAVSASVPVLTVCADLVTAGSDTGENPARLAIQVGSEVFTAILYANESTVALLRKLPMKLEMSELNGNEKYFYLPYRLPVSSQRIGAIKNGDIMLYGSDCFVLFYKSFPTSYSYTKLGYITDVTGLAKALGSGGVTVSFSVIE